MSNFFKEKHFILSITFVIVSFLLMIFISFNFLNSAVTEIMQKNTEKILEQAVYNLELTLLEPKSIVNSFALYVEDVVLRSNMTRKEKIDYIYEHMELISNNYLFINHHLDLDGLFGYFQVPGEDDVYIRTVNIPLPENFDVSTRQWFIDTKNGNSNCVETISYPDLLTNNFIILYTQNIYDKNKEWMGLVGLRVNMERLKYQINSLFINSKGYSILVYNSVIYVHPNEDYIFKKITELKSFDKIDFNTIGEEVFGTTYYNFREEKSLIFIQRMPNNWFIITVVPYNSFFDYSNRLLLILTIIGLSLASFLIFSLVQINKLRIKADLKSIYKDMFLSNMSHEIRTPINIVIGMSTIGKEAIDNHKKDYCFEKINDASKHLLSVINDILDISKIEANKLELIISEFDYKNMFNNIIDLYSTKIAEKKINLKVDISDDIPQILVGDDQRLSQVIVNLLSNAIKFTPENGSISISSKLISIEGNICTIETAVSDTGIGIPEENLETLFNSYEQVKDHTKKYGGTGLGLSISKQLVELMGGIIWVESRLNEGSSFIFVIKMKEGESDSVQITKEKLDRSTIDFSSYHILLVEDISINREIIEVLLEPTNIKIDIAVNGKEAVELFTKQPRKYDAILMDIQMPIMNGLTATKLIREQRNKQAKTIPILAMTASVLSSDIKNYKESGMDDYLPKPIDINEIITKMKKYMSQYDKNI